MKDAITDALEGNDFRFSDAEEDLESHPAMTVVEPPKPVKGIAEIDTEQDSKDDYSMARNALVSILEQQQEAVKSMVEFVNGSPSARAYEVLNKMIETTADNANKLMDLQKTVKELKAQEKPKDEGQGSGDKIFIVGGGPVDLVDFKDPIDVTPDK